VKRFLLILAVLAVVSVGLAMAASAKPDCDGHRGNSVWCRGTTTTTTTVAGNVLNLSEDLVITDHHAFSGHIEGNGFQILISGGTVDWDGFTVNNVRRIMFMNCAGPSTLRNGEVTNSGSPALGDYPLHWHLNGDCTRGTFVENVTVRNGAHHAFVPHGSHGITFLNVAAVSTRMSPFWWDAPGTHETCDFQKFCTVDNSNDIVVDGLFVDGVTHDGSSAKFRLTGVLLGAGSGNVLRNSTVINVGGQEDCSAYHWPESANGNVGGNVWVFENNHGESACHGIHVWQNDSNPHVVDGFTGGGIKHGAYRSNYAYRNVAVPYVVVKAVGWTLADSSVGHVYVGTHVFTGDVVWDNVSIGSLEVNDNADNHEGFNFYLNQANLTCADVTWTNPHPDTQIIINGVACGN
jgi:hypothetical protein